LSRLMSARLPQTKKEEYKNVSKERQKKLVRQKGNQQQQTGDWERERERKRKSQRQKRARGRGKRKNKRKCQFSSGKMGFTEQKLQQ